MTEKRELKLMNKFLILIIIINSSCSFLEKKDDYRRINKKGEIAHEFFMNGEHFRRQKQYSRSLKEFMKSSEIYRNKFDYKNEAKLLLKIGFVFSKLKNINGLNNVKKRLEDISKNVDDFQFKYLSLEIREAIEFNNMKKASELINKMVIMKEGVIKYYYIALDAQIKKYKEKSNIEKLLNWFKNEAGNISELNDIHSPEAILFINRVVGEISLKYRDKKLFDIAIQNSEKIINFYELIEYTDSVRSIKNSW